MVTRRIYIDNNRATVSKPGIDAALVTSNPSYRFLALDSRLDGELPLEVGFRSGVTLLSKVYYAGSYGPNVVADFNMYTDYGSYVAAYKPTMQRDDDGTNVVHRSAYTVIFEADGFFIADQRFYEATQALPSSFNVCYMVWRL